MVPHFSFHEAFTPELKSRISELLSEISEAATENFSAVPDYSTGMTFGVELYQFANQAFLKAAQEPEALFKAAIIKTGAFRCRAGEWNFGIYRVGTRSSDSIWESFPNPGNSAGEVGSAFLPGMEPDIEGSRGAIVAYMCDPVEGLGAIYLCIPETDSTGKITSWAYAEQIWSSEHPHDGTARGTTTRAPAESIDTVTVKRRARGGESAG